jgi:Protein of unknown function (DUF1566)
MKKAQCSTIFFLIAISLIFATYGDVFAEMKLRDKPKKLTERDIKAVVKKLNFFDKELNEEGNCPNDFVDNGDGTITDRTTGLMWEQKGSENKKDWYRAKKYVKALNKKKFAGYKDWRLPTTEELYSLLQPSTNQQLYIHSVFATKPSLCWSIDTSDMATPWYISQTRKVTLDYKEGTVSDAFTGVKPSGASANNFSSYVRAVRTIK